MDGGKRSFFRGPALNSTILRGRGYFPHPWCTLAEDGYGVYVFCVFLDRIFLRHPCSSCIAKEKVVYDYLSQQRPKNGRKRIRFPFCILPPVHSRSLAPVRSRSFSFVRSLLAPLQRRFPQDLCRGGVTRLENELKAPRCVWGEAATSLRLVAESGFSLAQH